MNPPSTLTAEPGLSDTVRSHRRCEVLSASTERIDRGRKLRICAEAGVAHAWFVKPTDRTLEVLSLRDGAWTIVAVWEGAAVVRAEPFAAIELELAPLWGDPPPASPESTAGPGLAGRAASAPAAGERGATDTTEYTRRGEHGRRPVGIDRRRKLPIYARAGVSFAWLVVWMCAGAVRVCARRAPGHERLRRAALLIQLLRMDQVLERLCKGLDERGPAVTRFARVM